MGWRQFVMELDSLEPDRVEALFSKHGALAVTLTDAGDDPVLEPGPGETPLWTDTSITGLFDQKTDLEPLKSELRAAFGRLPRSHIETLEDRVWEREWLNDFEPMRFGERLWVCPHDAGQPAADAVVIRLDPGLAFGTGTHATTALCLDWLESIDVRDRHVIDLGCGSGILAIGALKLGARSVDAVDIDAQALTASMQNAEANGVADRLRTMSALDDAAADADIIVANILAKPLIELAPAIAGRMAAGGRLALSGILSEQADAVAAVFRRWFELDPPESRGDWIRLSGTRRGD